MSHLRKHQTVPPGIFSGKKGLSIALSIPAVFLLHMEKLRHGRKQVYIVVKTCVINALFGSGHLMIKGIRQVG